MKIRSNVRAQPDEGVHMGRVVSLSDLGHQPGFTWAGGEADSAFKVELGYELVNLDMEDGRPFWLSEEVTNTDNERGKLRSRASAAGINVKDIDTILDKPVMITVEHNDKGYAKIVNVAGVPQGIEVPALRNPTTTFDIYDEQPDVEAFLAFPEFKQNKIRNALDFSTTVLSKALKVEEEQF